MPDHQITVCIPTIPPRMTDRSGMFDRALKSVRAQTHPATHIIWECDEEHHGAWHTRQAALDKATTPWVAFLDDDDEMLPHHLLTLATCQEQTGADVVVSWYEVRFGVDVHPENRHVQFAPQPELAGLELHSFGITCLVNRLFLLAHPDIRFTPPPGPTGCAGEDYRFWTAMARAGARFHQIPDVTWTYYHGGHNTSGLPIW